MATGGIGSFFGREEEAPVMDAGPDYLSQAGLLGIITSSMATTLLAAREPPPGLDKNAYLLTVAGAFFAGVVAIVATVRVSDNPRARRAAGRKLVRASLGSLAVVVGLTAASLL